MNIKLLLVDDDIEDLENLTEIILDISPTIKVAVAKNGNEMIRQLESEPQLPDFIFLDLNMPLKTGFECLTEIRSNEKWKAIKVVVLTTSTQREQINDVYKLGADLYIKKPNSYSAFKNMLSRCLQMDWGFEKNLNAFENTDNPRNFFDSRLVYNDIVENIGFGIVVINFFQDGNFFISYTNKEFHKIAPSNSAEISSDNNNQIFESTHSDDIEHVQSAVRQLFDLKEFDIEFRMVDAGKIKYIKSQGRPIYNNLGNCVTAYIYFNDITEQVKKQESLKVSEEKYKYMFENAPNPLLIWDFRTLNILDVNNKAVELYGYTKEEFTKLNIKQMRPTEDIPLIEAATKNLESYKVGHQRVWRKLKKSGELMYLDVNSQVFELNGKLVSINNEQDVTAKIKTEEELKLMDFAFKKSATPIILLLANGEFYGFNDAVLNLLGYTKEEFSNMNLLDVATAMDQASCVKQWDEIVTKKNTVFDCHFETKDGVLLDVEISSNFIYYNENEVSFCYINDITEKKKAAESLKLSAFTIDNAAWGLVYFKEDGSIYNCNLAFAKIYGNDSLEEMKTKTAFDFGTAYTIDTWKQYWEELKQKKNLHYVVKRTKKDGTIIDVEINANIIQYGDLELICGYVYDVTEKIRAEEGLKLSAHVIDKATTAIVLVQSDGSIYNFNEAACNMLGYNKKEFARLHQMDLDPNLNPAIIAEAFEGLKKKREISFETTIVKKGGALIDVEITTTFIVYDGLELKCSFLTEITEKKKAAAEIYTINELLQRQSNRLLLATKSAQLGVWDWDLENDTIFWDEGMYKLYGLVPNEFKSLKEIWLASVHEDDRIQTVNEIQYAISNNKECSSEFRIVWNDSSVHYLRATGFVEHINGKPKRMIGVSWDVTKDKEAALEKEKLLKELVANNLELKQFSYITSHNLRAPLTNLVSICDIIQPENVTDPFTTQLIEGFKTSTYHLNDTLNDLMEILIIKEDRNRPKDQLTFEEIFKKIKESLSISLQEQRVIINADFTAAPSVIFANEYLESVFLNLLTNSVKYRHPDRDPIITIKTSKEPNGETKLTFADNGIGINMAYAKDNIFGLYKRFHNNADSKGIGLYLIHSQITTLGGKIEVESEVNIGTTFTITFK